MNEDDVLKGIGKARNASAVSLRSILGTAFCGCFPSNKVHPTLTSDSLPSSTPLTTPKIIQTGSKVGS